MLAEIFDFNVTSGKSGEQTGLANFESIGIGLYVVSRFIEAMSSEIKVSSDVNGTTEFSFELVLPVGKTKEQIVLSNNTEFLNVKLLIVDDNKVNLMVTKKALQVQGISCITATESDPIIELILKNRISLVLMDLNMPGTDGYEWTKKIRSGGIKIPIIAHTAVIEEEIDMIKLKKTGLQDYIVKPYKMDTLINKIQKYLVCEVAADLD